MMISNQEAFGVCRTTKQEQEEEIKKLNHFRYHAELCFGQ